MVSSIDSQEGCNPVAIRDGQFHPRWGLSREKMKSKWVHLDKRWAVWSVERGDVILNVGHFFLRVQPLFLERLAMVVSAGELSYTPSPQ